VKLDVKTKTNTGVEFNTEATSNQDSGKVQGSLETKYKFKEYGLTVTEKWNTDNNLTAKLDLQDQLVQGLKLTLDSSFSPATGAKNGKLKAEFKHEQVTAAADADLNPAGPLVNASAVVGYQGWLAGYQLAFDTAKSQLTRNNFSLGYSNGDFVLHTNVNDGQVFGGSVYQRVNRSLETGVNLGWASSGAQATNFGIGCKYALDRDASVRAKINNSSQLGLGYQQRLRDGVTLTLSTLIDGKNFNQGGHKIGLALELEA